MERVVQVDAFTSHFSAVTKRPSFFSSKTKPKRSLLPSGLDRFGSATTEHSSPAWEKFNNFQFGAPFTGNSFPATPSKFPTIQELRATT